MAVWQVVAISLLSVMLAFLGSHLSHRWESRKPGYRQLEALRESSYERLQGLRNSLLQGYVSRFEALILSDYHEYKYRNLGAQQLDFEEAKRWLGKSETYVETLTDMESNLAECLADIRTAYKKTSGIAKLTEQISHHKIPEIKSPLRGEVAVKTVGELEAWKEKAVKDLHQLVETEIGRPSGRLAAELENQVRHGW